MSFPARYHSLHAVRVGTLLFPPAGLILLWRSSQIGLARKIFGSVGIGLYSLIYAGLVVWILHRFFGLRTEFRGGMVPRWTFHKTLPDYDALEASRAKQKQAGTSAPRPASSAKDSWPGFRGNDRDGKSAQTEILVHWPSSGLRTLWRQPS